MSDRERHYPCTLYVYTTDADAPLHGRRSSGLCAITNGTMTGNAAKNWCFTLNNYTDEDLERINGLGNQVQYLVVGKETGENGTPHLQGFVSLPQRKRMAFVKALIGGNPHVEVARNVPASIQYCKKDGDFTEIGAIAGGSGSRTDIDAFKEDVKGGNLSLKSIRELHSETYAKYTRFCLEYIQDHAPNKELPAHALRDWQQALNHSLNMEPDDRTITFCVDVTGNSGKTWFAHYYASLHPDKVQVLQPGRKADMAYALDATIRVLFIDAPRSKQGEFIQYDFLEDVKNGYVFSTKYESRVKQLEKCHVCVMMNEQPDMEKLSLDRYNIINL